MIGLQRYARRAITTYNGEKYTDHNRDHTLNEWTWKIAQESFLAQTSKKEITIKYCSWKKARSSVFSLEIGPTDFVLKHSVVFTLKTLFYCITKMRSCYIKLANSNMI
jgi:hypothetical protein